jgi:hypothetical protein
LLAGRLPGGIGGTSRHHSNLNSEVEEVKLGVNMHLVARVIIHHHNMVEDITRQLIMDTGMQVADVVEASKIQCTLQTPMAGAGTAVEDVVEACNIPCTLQIPMVEAGTVVEDVVEACNIPYTLQTLMAGAGTVTEDAAMDMGSKGQNETDE